MFIKQYLRPKNVLIFYMPNISVMKKLLTLLLLTIFLSADLNAQYVNIPDGSIKYLLQRKYPQCFNSSGLMDTTCSSILNEDSLNVNIYETTGVASDLEGIQYFKHLVYLDFSGQHINHIPSFPETLLNINCSGNSFLQRLPALPHSLKVLNCGNCTWLQAIPALPNSLRYLNYEWCNYLTSLIGRLPDSLVYLNCYGSQVTLPPYPVTLKYLNCGGNYNIHSTLTSFPPSLDTLICESCQITNLPALPTTLKYLDFRWNATGNIPVLPVGLQYLNCAGNNMSSLPALPPNLHTLICNQNNLQSLPALHNDMKILDCGSNPLYHLPTIPDSLELLACNWDSLSELPLLPAKIKSLDCSGNHLTYLSALPDVLTYLDCRYNELTNLPAIPSHIENIKCSRNNIRCLPYLPEPAGNARLTVELDSSKINCVANNGPGITFLVEKDWSGMISTIPSPPLCNPTNNINRCQAFPVISGYTFYDYNNNGIRDSNEIYKANIKIMASNNRIAYSDNHGYFEIDTDSLGTYSVSATAPNYYNAVPASFTYHFNTYDTIVSQGYALQANTVKDSLSIILTAANAAARPGFKLPYFISYENSGTTTLSPTIELNYDNTKLIYDSSTIAGVTDDGSRLLVSLDSTLPGQQQHFVVFFKVKSTTVIGDSVFSKIVISSNSAEASDSSKVFVRGSYDPNDKQATTELSPLQVVNGTYIDYTIRFQNTGNDTAFNVVISDVLAGELLLNTLKITASSHNCKVTVKDNIAFFEFLNILLPDSNTNESKSHGFISFRIKPHPSVPSGETIHNTAAIFFDYNAPVITNTTGTFIRPFSVVPTRLLSFSAIPQIDNTTALYWNTANEINTQQFVIEQGSDGVRFNTISSVVAKRRTNNNYSANVIDVNNSIVYYRLKIVNNDGSFTYSPIIKIDRRKNTAGFSVMTNPTKDFIVINTTDRSLHNSSCNIINSQAVVIKSFIIKEGCQTIDVKGLPAGVYYLRTARGSIGIIIH